MRTEISSDTHHSAHIDNNHNACDTSDEDPRPVKRRKPRLAPTVTVPTSRGYTPELYAGQPGPLVALSTATPEIDDAQPKVDNECLSPVDNDRQHVSRLFRSPSAASEKVPVAEYQEWPFQGFFKRIKIGDNVTYNLEFKLPSILENLRLPDHPKALDLCPSTGAPPKSRYQIPRSTVAHSTTRRVESRHPRARIAWTKSEDRTMVEMKKDGRSWEEISDALPSRTLGAIQVRYFTKLGDGTVSRRRSRR